ncbi:MAG TPA: energy transducer TonB [Fodinibius sp.]|nr:energy transducer TonB [Fodinibius sp.]
MNSIKLFLIALLTATTISCAGLGYSSDSNSSEGFDKSSYINPEKFGYDLKIRSDNEEDSGDETFQPVSVDGGLKYLQSKVEYPKSALRRRIKGTVLLEVYVDSTSKLSYLSVIGNSSRVLVDAAKEALKKVDFNAAVLKGEKVNSFRQYPISFRRRSSIR